MTVIEIQGSGDGGSLHVLLVVARYNDFVTERLLAGALEALDVAGVARDNVTVMKVPGAFEVPLAARRAAETAHYDAIVCLGCLIRGETPHFDYIASTASRGIAKASAEMGVPMSFGILTTNSAEQAIERAGKGPANKGWEAAMAAVEMATLYRTIAGARPRAGV
jgi:6,7-dimethyl-8-ribityllumazine synthase